MLRISPTGWIAIAIALFPSSAICQNLEATKIRLVYADSFDRIEPDPLKNITVTNQMTLSLKREVRSVSNGMPQLASNSGDGRSARLWVRDGALPDRIHW